MKRARRAAAPAGYSSAANFTQQETTHDHASLSLLRSRASASSSVPRVADVLAVPIQGSGARRVAAACDRETDVMVIAIVLSVVCLLGGLFFWSLCTIVARAYRAIEVSCETAVYFIDHDPPDVLRERIRTTPCYGRAAPLLSLAEFPPEDRRVLGEARN